MDVPDWPLRSCWRFDRHRGVHRRCALKKQKITNTRAHPDPPTLFDAVAVPIECFLIVLNF